MFGRYFGPAYQLYDDILDLTSTAEEMGKPVNADLPEGIYTLPVIRAAVRDQGLARLLRRAMASEQAVHARELVIASGAVDETQAGADEFLDQAAGRLATLPVDPSARHAMITYVRSILDRRTPGPAVPSQATRSFEDHSAALPQELMRWARSRPVDTRPRPHSGRGRPPPIAVAGGTGLVPGSGRGPGTVHRGHGHPVLCSTTCWRIRSCGTRKRLPRRGVAWWQCCARPRPLVYVCAWQPSPTLVAAQGK
ncbi:polyprenyl synthetase family protein [Nocardia brevicatena]|uniref:polyprenyl synthetase family protein n=1 Tax=Nocardia brevicatena TaxID=37327 RepID=UPI0009FF036E